VNKRTAIFGSYGWSRGAVETYRKMVEPLKWEVTDVLEFNGGASKDVLARAEEFGARVAAAVKA
jgi:flavorubredoxin